MLDALFFGDVLFWDTDSSDANAGVPSEGVYTLMGLTVHTSADWAGALSPYKLIFWSNPSADPTWWAEILAGWPGRLVMLTDAPYSPPWVASTDYLNSKTALTGITLLHSAGGVIGTTVEVDPLTAGVASFALPGAQRMTGATALSKETSSGAIILGHNKPSATDFVISGDSSGSPFNTQFSQNLWNVPL